MTTLTHSNPPPPIQFLLIDVESETRHVGGTGDSPSLALERPYRLAGIRRRSQRYSAPATGSSGSISWATATTPPRMCL
jgi:hypothetical protein